MDKSGKEVLADISYNPYVAFYCFMDSEWSIKRSKEKGKWLVDSLLRDHAVFNGICKGYRDDINRNSEEYFKAKITEGKPDNDKSRKLPDYLFNPINYITLGFSDLFALVLLDDFDPINHINTSLKTPIEDVGIAFCPSINSLSLHDVDLSDKDNRFYPNDEEKRIVRNVFSDLHELPQDISADINNIIKGHNFQKKSPLLAFTKYKMMGQGILIQQALFRAMAAKIMKALILLKRRYESSDNENFRKILCSFNIDSIKIVFLDLQATEEIGTLIICDNYSLAMTLVAAIRSITFCDLFRTDLSGFLYKSIDHKLMRSLNHDIAKNQSGFKYNSKSGSVKKNHVFKWTNTSLAIAPQAFCNLDQSRCNGFVEAFTEVQISPGHQKAVERRIKETCEGEAISCESDGNKNVFHFFYIGVSDYIFQNIVSDEKNIPKKIIPLSSVLDLLKINLMTFGTKKNNEDQGRDVIDILTRIAVPVPDLKFETGISSIFGDIDSEHFSLISESLSVIKNRLFYSSEYTNNVINRLRLTGKQFGQLDISKLKKVPRLYGVPVSLRRNIELLFQNYASLFSDPFMFDSVIDLYDTFAALHYLLTDCLYRRIKLERKIDTIKRGPICLDDGRIKQLSKLVEAINDALLHRTTKTYPDGQNRDLATDFRGGMNQILYAADAPIKCGLSSLRKLICEYNINGMNIDKELSSEIRVGGTIKIGYEPGARCFLMNFGTEENVKLAYFELDVPHIFHAVSYGDSLHETFHLIFDQLCAIGVMPEDFKKINNDAMNKRIKEIFANLLCQLFIFGNDTKKSLFYFISSYLKSPVSVGSHFAQTLIRLSEVLIRLFIVIDAIPEEKNIPFDNNVWKFTDKEDVNSALIRYKKMVGGIADAFIYEENQNNREKKAIDEYLWQQFKSIYRPTIEHMGWIWRIANMAFRKIYRTEFYVQSIKGKNIKKAVEESLKNSMPISRKKYFLYLNENKRKSVSEKYGDERYSLALICRMLCEYIPDPVKNRIFNKKIMLRRNFHTHNIEYNKADWYEFQIDKGLTQMFAPVPDERAKRLRKQIAMIKTFWDIAAYQREKRLAKIVDDNW